VHKPLGWVVNVGFKEDDETYTIQINGVKFEEMAEAPPRERAALARSAITMNMIGLKKSVKFGFLLNGDYISASAILNMHTKFAKL